MNGHTQAIKCANHFFQLRLLLAATCIISTKSWSWCYTLTFLTQFGPRDVNDTVLAWIRRPHISHASYCKCIFYRFCWFLGLRHWRPITCQWLRHWAARRGTNAGGAYNPNTSTFTCPTTAYYYIYFSLFLSKYYRDCRIDITMEDSMIAMVRHITTSTSTCISYCATKITTIILGARRNFSRGGGDKTSNT